MSDSSQPAPISKHRLLEARRLGYTPRSPELTSGVMLLTAAWIGYVSLPTLGLALQELVASGFQSVQRSTSGAAAELAPALIRIGQEVLRIAAACWAAALVADLAQVGFVWSPVTLLPHEERVSPLSGMARLLSGPTFERAGLLTLKIVLAVALVAGISEMAVRSMLAEGDLSGGESPHLWQLGRDWLCLALACAGTGCLFTGVVDAWTRQTRWRLSVEQTEDEQRRG